MQSIEAFAEFDYGDVYDIFRSFVKMQQLKKVIQSLLAISFLMVLSGALQFLAIPNLKEFPTSHRIYILVVLLLPAFLIQYCMSGPCIKKPILSLLKRLDERNSIECHNLVF